MLAKRKIWLLAAVCSLTLLAAVPGYGAAKTKFHGFCPCGCSFEPDCNTSADCFGGAACMTAPSCC
jgi:hypothetical protein